MFRRTLCFILAATLPAVSFARTVEIPAGTAIYLELDEKVTSKKKQTSQGDLVRAHVWRDVRVDGQLVIPAWAPVDVRVSNVQKARIAGRKGELELEAVNVVAADGRNVPLAGGYDKSGKGRVGLTVALAAVVALPLIFLKGKQAVLDSGTVFDATVRSSTLVEAEGEPAPKLTMPPELDVSVLYDRMDPEGKLRELPLALWARDGEIAAAQIVTVNGQRVPDLPIQLAAAADDGTVHGTVDFKSLSKHFTKGMNRFDVRAGGETVEVVLEIEF